MLLEPRQSALIVEQAVERVGFSEVPLGVDQRSTEQFDETAGTQRAGESIGALDGSQQIDRLTELQPSIVETAGCVVHRAEQAARVAFCCDIAAQRGAGQRGVEIDFAPPRSRVARSALRPE